jgi:hypothetical protein
MSVRWFPRIRDPDERVRPRFRAPIDTSRGHAPTDAEFRRARDIVACSRVLDPLRRKLDSRTGRPRSLTLEAFLMLLAINGLRRHHQGHVVSLARILNSLTPSQLHDLGIRDLDPRQSYDRLDRLFNKVAAALDAGWDDDVDGRVRRIDAAWVLDRLIQASLNDLPIRSSSLAVDGTAIEGWGHMRGEMDPDQLKEEFSAGMLGDDALLQVTPPLEPSKKPKRPAKVFGKGPEGKNRYTPDPDARPSWRTATNSTPGRFYNGYEAHLAVQTPDVKWTNGVDKVTKGQEVPAVIMKASVVSAGSHRADSIFPLLIDAKRSGEPIQDVIVDRGYSQLKAETTVHPLRQAGIHMTFRPKGERQEGLRPFSLHAVAIDGMLYSSHMPPEWKKRFRMPPPGATVAQKLEYEERFNKRASYRYQHHQGPDSDGVTRWMCPVHAGFVWHESVPKSLQKSDERPPLLLPREEKCCDGVVAASAAALPFWQWLVPGTTAWRTSMDRRQAAESANAGLKGGFVNVERGFVRTVGRTKHTILFAFAVVGYNMDRIRAWVSLHVAPRGVTARRGRAKRRKDTWQEILHPQRPTPDAPSG